MGNFRLGMPSSEAKLVGNGAEEGVFAVGYQVLWPCGADKEEEKGVI